MAVTTMAIVEQAGTASLVLQIKGYSLSKGLGRGKFIKSSTFSVGGHHWYVRCYPDSVVNADWISIFLCLDHTDAVDVKARLKFSVLDATGESVPKFTHNPSVDDTFSSKNPCWGFPKIVNRKALEESSCLRDDCLKVRCDVIVSKDIRTEATTQFVVVPPPNLNKHFCCLLSGAEGADVTFEVAGEMFAAHRCVLAARSSVFKAELFGYMKEKTMNCIRIQEMEARVFKAMLQFIYTDTMPDIDKEDAFAITQNILVAADRYDLERLKLICEDKLCNCINASTVAMTLVLAEWHGCHGLKKACFEFLKSRSHLETVMATEGFDHLLTTCPSVIKQLLLAKNAACP